MALFSVAEARAFDKGQIANVADFPDATITAKEAEIREWLEKACGVNFESTGHDEWYDGDGSDYLQLKWPEVTAVTSITIDGTALSATQIDPDDFSSGLAIDTERGLLTLRGGQFTAGWSNVNVVYTAGFTTVPALVKRAALRVAVMELPATLAPWTADSYSAGDVSYSFGRGDGFNGQWSADPVVMAAIRMYDRHLPGIA